jgi:hypothetical protein
MSLRIESTVRRTMSRNWSKITGQTGKMTGEMTAMGLVITPADLRLHVRENMTTTTVTQMKVMMGIAWKRSSGNSKKKLLSLWPVSRQYINL